MAMVCRPGPPRQAALDHRPTWSGASGVVMVPGQGGLDSQCGARGDLFYGAERFKKTKRRHIYRGTAGKYGAWIHFPFPMDVRVGPTRDHSRGRFHDKFLVRILQHATNIHARPRINDDGNRVGGVYLSSHDSGVITKVEYKDSQLGDMDFTHGDSDVGEPSGFTKDVNVYTFVAGTGPGGGTYLQIDVSLE